MSTFKFTGALLYNVLKRVSYLPQVAKNALGKTVDLPKDPWFLIGNHRLSVFTHASGLYEILTGQRAWATINQSKDGY